MKRRLCCIEPSGPQCQVIEDMAQSSSWVVEFCYDLKSAKLLLKQHPPDLIIISSVFISGNFKQCISKLRSLCLREMIPVAMLTVTEDHDLATQALRAGITEVFYYDKLASLQIYLDSFVDVTGNNCNGRRAMILEDDRAIALYLEAVLVSIGIDVEVFHDKTTALSAALTERFDLIITDLILDCGKSGTNFIRMIRQLHGRSASAPIIAISGFPDDARRIEALRAGAVIFLDKPVLETELLFHVQRLLVSGEMGAVPTDSLTVFHSGQAYGLSDREHLICGLVEVGYSDKDIARQLGISFWTVRTHLGRIFRKCCVTNRIELINTLRRTATTAGSPVNEVNAASWELLTAKVMDQLQFGIAIVDEKNVILKVNPALCRITGYSALESIGKTPRLWSSGQHRKEFYQTIYSKLKSQGAWSGEVCNRRKNGQLFPAWLDIRFLGEGAPLGARYVGVIVDNTERQLEIEHIRHSALHDPLTGLPNRALFKDRVIHEIACAGRIGSQFACIFIDLDNFKPINDAFGHEIGDHVLREVADRLRSVFRSNDTVARLGGDEFAALASGIANRYSALALSSKIIRALSSPLLIDEKEYSVSASIGISMYPADGDNFEKLLANADAAMYSAKDAGGGQAFICEPMPISETEYRQAMEVQMYQAIKLGQFELWFQPRLDLEENDIVAVEALLRWNHPDRGLITCDEFIPFAESSGLINSLGAWMLHEACRVLLCIHERGQRQISMAVNISPQQVSRKSFIDEVITALAYSGLEAGALQLQLTELALKFNVDHIQEVLGKLSEIGISIALDNFGQNKTDLSLLAQFPFDTVKIDRRLINSAHADRYNASFIRTAIQLANGLNMTVVADGVESSNQSAYLKDVGFHHAQGFQSSGPVRESELLMLIANHSKH